MITKSDSEIFNQIDKANEKIESGDIDRFRSYEDGVKEALEWVLGIGSEPIDDLEDE
jgi:hypothetical protein